jgi:hypothetical protein
MSKKTLKIIIGVLLIIIVALIIYSVSAHRKIQSSGTNIEALQDSIHVYKLKNDALMYEKQGFLIEKKDLEKYIGISESERRELEKKLDDALLAISIIEGNIRIDTINMTDTTYISLDSVMVDKFSYNDRWINIDGTTIVKDTIFNTSINKISMDAPLKVGISKDNKWFVTTENPYLSFSSVEGAMLEQSKNKRWSVGIQLGVGVLAGYGVQLSGTIKGVPIIGAGLYGGIGVTYKLIDF